MKICPPTTAFDDGFLLLQGYPEYLNGKPHTGIDIYAQKYKGHKPRMTEDGRIVDVYRGGGKTVSAITIEVESTNDRLIYAHCITSYRKGQELNAGEIIGELDDSGSGVGKWQGYHLHFGFLTFPDYERGDPMKYILERAPKMKIYARPNIIEYYRKKDYFDIINFEASKW